MSDTPVNAVPPALPCIICDAELENIFPPNQPLRGTAFNTRGHYGSTVFDPMDDSRLEINICDDCLRLAIITRKVGKFRTSAGNSTYEIPSDPKDV